jgi:beta-lactamase regulating signal transducer with metallopeptidase domain
MFDPRIVTAWLLTYLLHSTLFLGLTWLAARGPLRRRPSLEEAAWRFALVAALVTASVQLAAGREPLAGRWGLAAPDSIALAAPADTASTPAPEILLHRAFPIPSAVQAREAASPAPVSAQPFPWALLVAGLWTAGAVALGARWLAAHLYLRRRLRARPQVVGGDMHSALRRLAGEAGLAKQVRLSCSSRLPVPIALGLRRPEICVPPRALAALSAEQQEGLLAHELAHLVRRDPFWLAFSHLLSSILFFQPLNQVARRRLRELSELRSDEWAVGQTGRPVSLARCLAEVAGWSLQPLNSLVAPGMADRPSHLAHRIRHLLNDARSPERRVRPLWLAAGMAVLLVAVVAAAPVVAPATPALAGGPAGSAPAVAPAAAGPVGQPPTQRSGPKRQAPAARQAAAEPETAGDDLDVPEAGDPDLADGLVEETLGGMDAQLESLYDREHLSAADEKELEAQISAAHAQIEQSLKPSIDELGRRLDEVTKEFESSPALKDLEARAKEIDQKYRISDAEMAKIAADAEKMAAAAKKMGRLTEEEKERIRTQAHEMAEQARLSEKDRAELDELTRKVREEQQRFMKEHAVEIEAMRQQIREQAAEMREEIRRRIESDPRLKARLERRRQEMDKEYPEMSKHRDEMRRQREELRKKRLEEKDRREKDDHGDGHSGAVSGGVQGGVQGGVEGGIPRTEGSGAAS